MDGSPEILSGSFAGRYRIERELGRGATATVYLARDEEADRAVAIKVLRPELATTIGADRFLREIAVNERLKHPNIVPVLDSGDHEGRLFFVLPHMEGGSLRHVLRREKQISLESAIDIARAMCDALEFAHDQGLIHRDVKPENILFTEGRACLADFGIARAIERTIDESTTSTGLVRGTPAYMSPEQASGAKDLDGRTDQFSLACVVYEMLAGVAAFIGPTPEAIISQRFLHAPRKVTVYRPSVSPGLEGVLERALAMLPADRFASIGAFGEALRDAPREPTSEAPVPTRRTPTVRVAAAGALTLALVAVAIFGVADPAGPQQLDSTRYLILPVDGVDTGASRWSQEQLYQAVGAWKGIEVVSRFEVEDMVPRGMRLTDAAALPVSRKARAGRYLRSRVSSDGPAERLELALVDANSGSHLGTATALIDPRDTNGASVALAIRNLLLRRSDSSVTRGESRVLAAAALFHDGVAARSTYQLELADSLLALSVAADPGYGRAALWLAETRFWRERPPASWIASAQRASADNVLSPDELVVATALAAVARGDFATACAAFRRRTQQRAMDVAAWYGLANCLRRDSVVIRDSRSPSGWRYRSSYAEAVGAYSRAFQLSPSLIGSFRAGGYDRLLRLLFARENRLRPGSGAAPDTTRFAAHASWHGDTLTFIPYPIGALLQAPPDPTLDEAVRKQRELFARLARGWAAAAPRSASAKEATAIALDIAGSEAAIDTIVAARALATDAVQRAQLANEELLLRLVYGRVNPSHILEARRLADSVLRNTPPRVQEMTVGAFANAAVVLGQCALAGRLAARAARPSDATGLGLPHTVLAAAESLTLVATMGCLAAADSGLVAALARRARAAGPAPGGASASEYRVLAQTARIAPNPGDDLLRDLATVGRDYILQARRQLRAGHRDSVRSMLQDLRRARGAAGTSRVTPDVALAEALLWLELGDSAAAAAWVEPLLARRHWLDLMVDRPVGTASLMRAAALHAVLAAGAEGRASSWARFGAILWTDADPPLQPLHRTLRRFAAPPAVLRDR